MPSSELFLSVHLDLGFDSSLGHSVFGCVCSVLYVCLLLCSCLCIVMNAVLVG